MRFVELPVSEFVAAVFCLQVEQFESSDTNQVAKRRIRRKN